MVLLDVNVLVYAHRRDAPRHAEYSAWFNSLVSGTEPVGLALMVLSGFLRIVTHRRIFDPPTPINTALAFAEQLRTHPNCQIVGPGARHWDIFASLCRQTRAMGNRIPDAFLAALAIERGSLWFSADRGFSRYPGLRWRHPLGGY